MVGEAVGPIETLQYVFLHHLYFQDVGRVAPQCDQLESILDHSHV